MNFNRCNSVHMEDVYDEDTHQPNAASLNPSSILELIDSDGEEDDCPPLIEVKDDKDKDDEDEDAEESAETELDKLYACQVHCADNIIGRLSKGWDSPVYVFFEKTPDIVYINDHRVHVFECAVTHCKGKGNDHIVRCYLDTGDAKAIFTNMQRFAGVMRPQLLPITRGMFWLPVRL